MKLYSDGLKCSTSPIEDVSFEFELKDTYQTEVIDKLDGGNLDKIKLYDLIVTHNLHNYLTSVTNAAMICHKQINETTKEPEAWYFNDGIALTPEEVRRIKHNKVFEETIETVVKK